MISERLQEYKYYFCKESLNHRMTEEITKHSTDELIDAIIDGVGEVKGEGIVVLDLRKLHQSVADYFLICHGNSNTQVNAISRSVEEQTEKLVNESPWHVEGRTNAEWVLMDYGDVVVHIFHKDARDHYALEELWADAESRLIENRA